jgi:hypothetical protein
MSFWHDEVPWNPYGNEARKGYSDNPFTRW